MFDPKLAIDWLIAKQQLCLKMELPLDDLVNELHQYVDQFSEEDLSGLADFLALYAEQLESLDESSLPQAEASVTAVANLLEGIFSSSADSSAQALVAALQSEDWPDPVSVEDAEFLHDLLFEDCQRLSSEDAVALATELDDIQIAGRSESEIADNDQPQGLINQHLPDLIPLIESISKAPDQFNELFADDFYELIDQYSDADWTGFSDLMALFGELLVPLEDVPEVALELSQALIAYLERPEENQLQILLQRLGDERWPDPVADEDTAFLQELLEKDYQRLVAGGASSESAPLSDEQAFSIEAELGFPAEGRQETDNKATVETDTNEVSAECLEEQVEEKPEACERIAGSLPDLMPLIITISDDPVRFEDVYADEFYERIDQYADADWTGFSDLMALYGELLITLEGKVSAVADELSHAFLKFLSQPETTELECLLSLLSDERWVVPVDQEDVEFLRPLLLEELERMGDQSSAAESTSFVEGPLDLVAESDSEPSLILPEPAAFCAIDFSLLEQEGPQIDPAVLEMLSQSLSGLLQQWKQAESYGADLLESTIEGLSPVIRALDTINLLGARVLVEGLITNCSYIQLHCIPLHNDTVESVLACLDALLEYFVDISIYERQQTLLDQFVDTQLPCKPNTEEASFIMGLLALASLQQTGDLEQEQATAEDVVLQESDEIDPQLLDMLHNELPTLSEEFLNSIQSVLDQQDQTALRSSQRAVHTLKGLANMAGIKGLANLAHRLEDILEFLSEAEKLPKGQLSADLLEAADCIAAMSETVTDGVSPPDNALTILQSIMDWDYLLKTQGVDALETERLPVTEASNNSEVHTEESVPSVQAVSNSEETVDSGRGETPVLRVPRPILDNLFRLAGESSTLNTQLDEEVTQLRGFTRTNRERHRNLQRILFELEQQFSEQVNLQPHLDENSEEFDPLEMDRYNEIHTTISRVQEAVADVREVTQEMESHIQNLSTLHIAQSGLQKETLDNVMSTRLVEVKTIASRLQRILRQACRATDKQARLVIEGENTLVDSHILNQLADPLMHIIRNAVDHGLESTRLRQQRGKPEEGTIKLAFSLSDNQIEVRCEDDGDGINTQRVLAVAEEKKLIEPELELTEDDIHRLILIPGFSTRGEINQLSGRGIGMDVVYQQILRLQGTLDIRSQSREGTCFHLSMPASSLMIRSLLVRCGKQVFALSGHGVEQSLISLDGQFSQQDDQLSFEYEGENYPVFMLESLLDERGFNYHEPGQVNPVLIVNMAQGERVAVLVKEIIAHRELAFKQMSDFLPDLPGIPGLTILSNGEAAPIIDLPARIRYKRASVTDQAMLQDVETELELPRLLVVDDSLSARKSLETLLRDTGYEVLTAIDGLDALNQVRKRQPDLILTDMEMPRMGGVELATVLRNRDETANIPVLMITSRSTEKHRQEADEAGVSAYITKPWTENQLLDQVDNLLAEACI